MSAKAEAEVKDHNCVENLVLNRRGNTKETERIFPSEDGHAAHCVVCWKGYH